MVKLQKGGAKLIHPEKTGFSATFDMLHSEGSRLELLTHESLYGFMFELIVQPKFSEYYTFDATRKFSIPITNFILKLVVTTPLTIKLPEYKNVNKSSETPVNFLNEANTQQDIWLKSISGGRPEICPAVANLSLFVNQQSHLLIYWLFVVFGKNGINYRNDVTDVLHYLFRILTKPMCGIGVILMPKIMQSSTFSTFVRSPSSPSSSEILEATSNILAQVVRLFIVNGIIHTDLHKSNVLVYPSSVGIKSEIIDFGRVINVKDMPNVEKDIRDIIDKLFTITQDAEKQQFINNVIGYIQNVINTQIASPKNAQMLWLINFANQYPHVYSQSFDTLRNYYVVLADNTTRLIPSTIKSYISSGFFYDLNHPLSDFYVSLIDLNSDEFKLASKTAVSTSSIEMASAPEPPVQKEEMQMQKTKRSWTDTQNETDRPFGRAKINNNTDRTIVDDVGSKSTIVDDVDSESTIVDEVHYNGGKKSRKQRRRRSKRKQSKRKQSKKNKNKMQQRRTRSQMRKSVNGLKSNQ